MAADYVVKTALRLEASLMLSQLCTQHFPQTETAPQNSPICLVCDNACKITIQDALDVFLGPLWPLACVVSQPTVICVVCIKRNPT